MKTKALHTLCIGLILAVMPIASCAVNKTDDNTSAIYTDTASRTEAQKDTDTDSDTVTEALNDEAESVEPALSDEPEPVPEPDITEITLSFVGDCMLATDRGGEYEGSFNKLANEVEPSYFFENFTEIFENDDWTVANLENVFTDNPNVQRRSKGYTPAYWYKSGTKNTAILNAGSIEIVSLANNHSEDYGAVGYEDTRKALDDAGVLWGDNSEVLMLEKNGFKIALYLCTFYYGGNERQIVEKLAAVEADYKIVYFHGGTERVHIPDEWKANGARYMVDNGVDLVIGGHPHVLQPIEKHNGKTIVHSLGNFVFGGSRSEENRTIVYQLKLTVTDGNLTEAADNIIPCYVYTDLYKPGIITDEAEIVAVDAFLFGESESPLS